MQDKAKQEEDDTLANWCEAITQIPLAAGYRANVTPSTVETPLGNMSINL